MVLFIAGNLISAVAPDYSLMMIGRIIAALAHGAFFGIGAVVAASMVAPDQKGRGDRHHVHRADGGQRPGRAVRHHAGPGRRLAVHLLGDHRSSASWRWSASSPWCRTAGAGQAGGLRGELRAFRSGQVWLSILVTILGYGGMFGAFTYIAFTLTEVTGFSASTVPWLLILFGVGLFIGNTAGGKAADRNVDRTLLVALAALVVVLVVFALTAGNQPMTIASMVLLGGFGFATVPGLQMRVMKYATTAPTLASGANIGAFNVGNALGAWMGGVTITAGLGYTSPIWAGAGITLLGLAVMVFAAAAAKRHDGKRGATAFPPRPASPVRTASGRARNSSGPSVRTDIFGHRDDGGGLGLPPSSAFSGSGAPRGKARNPVVLYGPQVNRYVITS